MTARSQTVLAYDLIKNLILDLELRPGELVTEKRLMELTGCGRMPVREAMHVCNATACCGACRFAAPS